VRVLVCVLVLAFVEPNCFTTAFLVRLNSASSYPLGEQYLVILAPPPQETPTKSLSLQSPSIACTMAAHIRDNLLHGEDHADDHASANRWRHQESRSYAQHAGPREADERHGSKDLANFFNSSRIGPPQSAGSGSAGKHKPIALAGNVYNGGARQGAGSPRRKDIADSYTELELKCGPLLNYRRMENETWVGSVLIVTKGGGQGGGLGGGPEPYLLWKTTVSSAASEAVPSPGAERNVQVNGSNEPKELSAGPYGTVNGVDYTSSKGPVSATQVSNDTKVTNGSANATSAYDATGSKEIKVPGTKLYSDPSNTFWRFDLQVPMQQSEVQCSYNIPGLRIIRGTKTDEQNFFIPAISESMRIMFHSCNGFSVGTDEEAWSGPALWNDVMRVHQKTPFHVM
jgi:hypothetical protein